MKMLLTALAEQARQLDVPVASRPLTAFCDEAATLRDRTTVDETAISAFMDRRTNYQTVGTMSRMLLSIHPMEALRKEAVADGFVSLTPLVYEDAAYYPHIALGVDVKKPDVRGLNFNFRHELAHLTQTAESSLYNRPNVLQLVRTAGMLAVVDGMLDAPNAGSSLWSIAGVVAGTLAALNPASFLHNLTPDEKLANLSALRHRQFNPISISPET